MKKKYETEIFILNDKYLLLEDVLGNTQGQTMELDLGCGSGDLAAPLAARFPDRLVLAADVMLGRLRKTARKGDRLKVNNLRLLRVDARHLCGVILPDNALDRLHIICPDPWPKHKHAGHRLMSSDFMAHLHRVIKPGGVLHFATDDVTYLESSVNHIRMSGLFSEAPASAIADIADIKTEFERQWLADGKSVTHTAWHPEK